MIFRERHATSYYEAWVSPPLLDHVLQAHEGCGFDFLRGREPLVDEVIVVD